MKFSKVLFFTGLAVTICISSCKPKDSDIKTTVDMTINATPELSGIKAEVKEGVVTLLGTLKDSASLAKAISLTEKIKGVKSVVNNLAVSQENPANTAPAYIATADEMLIRSVNDALKDFPEVKSAVSGGVVTLSGSINKSSLQRLMVLIHSLKPKKIENKLILK